MKRKNKIILSLSATLMLANSVYAKEPTSLESITVTAQKVEQNIQEVPISITVLNEFDIEDNGIRTLSDVASYVPNFQQFSVGGAGMYIPAIRGLSANIETGTSTVGTYIDGVPYLHVGGNDVVLEDIERIEVLKGPQGTLYGKNAYAGVINVITKKPNNETRGKIKAEFGSDNKKEYSFSASGAVIKDKFYVGVSAKHYEKDGFIQNKTLNKKDDDRKDDFTKLYLRYTPTDNLDISLITSYLKKDDGANTTLPLTSNGVRETASDFQGYNKSKSITSALKIEYERNDIDYSSVTIYNKNEDMRGTDLDYSPNAIMHSKVDSEYKSYSQEFKVNGEKDKFRWLTGLFLDKNEENPYTTMNGNLNTKHTTKSDGIGIFANIDYDLKKDLILSAGLRYDKDNIEIKDPLNKYNNDKSYSEISPKIALNHILNKDFTSYVSISKGYKRGGYFMYAPVDLKGYDKETLWNYELGFKSKSLEDKLTLNMSIFYMDITNMQVATNLTPVTNYISNAGEATSKGFEIETSYQAMDSLNIFANIGYAQTKYDKYIDNLGDYSGNYNLFAPKYNYSLGAKYRDVKGIFAKFDINGQDSYFADKANKFKSKKYAIANAKIGYETEKYEIYLYCNNIGDKKYDLDGFYNYYTMVSPPRETGISIAYRF